MPTNRNAIRGLYRQRPTAATADQGISLSQTEEASMDQNDIVWRNSLAGSKLDLSEFNGSFRDEFNSLSIAGAGNRVPAISSRCWNRCQP